MMKRNIVRQLFAGLLLLGLVMPGISFSGDSANNCSLQGTWFGVVSPEDTTLTGWVVSVAGKHKDHGTNVLEYPNFDTTLSGNFPTATRMADLRGAWERTGNNTFAYTMMGMAVADDGTPVYIGKLSGDIILSRDCNSEYITARLEVYSPTDSPFEDDPLFPIPLPPHYGYRAYVALP